MTPAARKNNSSGNATILTYLSLFLLLLVFFLVIVANSTEKGYRVKAVLSSIERRFGPVLMVSGRMGGDAAVAVAGRALRSYGELFETELALAKVEEVRGGQHLVVTLPEQDLIAPDGQSLHPARQGLIDRIARTLRDHSGPFRATVDVLLRVGGDAPDNRDPVARAALLGRLLLANGAPAEAISVGLEPGTSGTIRFLFAIVPADEAPRADEEPGHGRP